jgi:predicted Zn-dependent peptidase
MQDILNRSVSPKITKFNPDLFGIESLLPYKTIFANGIPCYQINKGTQELVKIEFLFEAGTYYQQKKFSAFSCLQLLTEGTQSYSSEQISQTFDFYGAYIEKEIDRDFATISVYCLTKYLDRILPIVEEIIKYPCFPTNELQIFSEKQKSQLTINKEKVNYNARTKFTEIIFGATHPYGAIADITDIESTTTDDLKYFHNNFLSSMNCKILISGKIEFDCMNLLDKYFGNSKWGSNQISLQPYINPNSINELKHYIVKDNAVQSAIRIGKEMFNFHNPDYFKFQMLNTILGGYFGSRLMKNIREDKGYTYGIGSAFLPLKYSGYFFITSEVGKEYSQKTIHEIYFEIERLTKDIVEKEELNLVKNYKYGEFIRSIDGPFAIAEAIKPLILYDLNFDYYSKYLKSIEDTTAEELYIIANKYFTNNNFIELIVGKK